MQARQRPCGVKQSGRPGFRACPLHRRLQSQPLKGSCAPASPHLHRRGPADQQAASWPALGMRRRTSQQAAALEGPTAPPATMSPILQLWPDPICTAHQDACPAVSFPLASLLTCAGPARVEPARCCPWGPARARTTLQLPPAPWSCICWMGLAGPSSTQARTTRHSFCAISASPRCACWADQAARSAPVDRSAIARWPMYAPPSRAGFAITGAGARLARHIPLHPRMQQCILSHGPAPLLHAIMSCGRARCPALHN